MLQRLLLALLLASPAAYSATVTLEAATSDTTATPNTSDSFTPATGDLLVVFCSIAASVENPAQLTSSAGGQSFTQFAIASFAGSTHTLYGFVSNTLAASASAQTVTCDAAVDTGTGTNIVVYSITGMDLDGTDAIRQSKVQANQAASGTPAPAFDTAARTGNVTLGAVANETNPAGLTAPTSWTESTADIGHASPDIGLEAVFRNSGFTGTTVTWGSASASRFASMIVELNVSQPASFGTSPTVTAETLDTYTVSYNTDDAADVFLVAVKKDSAACTCDDIEANTCAGEVEYATETATNNADTLDITIPGGDPFPVYDLQMCAEGAAGDSSVVALNDETLDEPTGRNYFVKSGSPGAGEEGMFDDASPAAADGDYGDVSENTDSFTLGDDAHVLTANADTTFEIDAGGDTSRQLFTRRFYDVSAGDWSDATAVAYAVNNGVPVYDGPDSFLFEKDATGPVPVTDLFSDPEGDTLTLSFTNQPAGGATDGTTWDTSFSTCGEYATVQPKGVDPYGDFDESTVTVIVGDLVPDVAEDDEATAVAAIEAVCSLTAVAGVSIPDPLIPAGSVVVTSPVAGTLVEPDAEITYSLSLGDPSWVIPDCDNLTVAQCEEEILEVAPWRAGNVGLTVEGYVCGTGQSFMRIAEQDPAADAVVEDPDEPITVNLVGIVMPDLFGMTEAEARAAIEAAECP